MLKRITDWAISNLTPKQSDDLVTPETVSPSDFEQQSSYWKQRAETAERRANELFEACLGFEQQRDRWARMYHQQAAEHTAAQVHLAGRIERLLMFISSALQVIQKLRAAQGLEPWTPPRRFTERDLNGNSITYAEEFVAKQQAVLRATKTLFDYNPMSVVKTPIDTAT